MAQTAAARRIDPSRAQLAAALALARLPGWPADLDEALSDPLVSRLVRLHAMRIARGQAPAEPPTVHHRPAVCAPEAPHPAGQGDANGVYGLLKKKQGPSAIDLKRAAAGDKD